MIHTKEQRLQAEGSHLVFPSWHNRHLLNVTNLSTEENNTADVTASLFSLQQKFKKKNKILAE